MVKREIISRDEVMRLIDELVRLLTPRQRDELQRQLHIVKYTKNQVIYSEGDVPAHLMCLVSGKAKIYKEGIGGRSQIVRVVKPGEYFAYRAYFANENYVTAAAAFETSVVCLLPMPLIYTWMKQDVDLALFFVRQLSRDLGQSDQRTVSLTQKHIRGRLAEALLLLKANYGTENDGATLSIRLSREDLASLSNMTSSNAIRTLSAFAREGIITVDGRRITLTDEPALQRISHIG